MADDSVGRAHTSNEPVNASGSGVAAAASTPARPFTVVVVGAGLGGLCFANGLVNGVLESPLVGYKLLLNDSVDQNSGETAEAGASTEGKDASQATAGDDTPPSAAAGTATDGVEPASKAATAVPQDDRAQPPGQSSDGGTAEAHGSGAASPASRGVGDAADAGGANGAGTEPEVDAAFCPGIKEAGGNMRLVVLERDETPDFRSQGYYIGIQQHGLDAMKAVGLLDAVVHQPRTRKAHGREAFEFVTQKGMKPCPCATHHWLLWLGGGRSASHSPASLDVTARQGANVAGGVAGPQKQVRRVLDAPAATSRRAVGACA